MLFVYGIMFAMFAADAWWWWVADQHARKLGNPWRIGLGIFMGSLILGLLLLVLARLGRMHAMIMPELAVVLLFIWHFILLPVLFVPSVLAKAVSGITKLVKDKPAEDDAPDASRRAFLAQVVVAAPPVLALGLVGKTVVNRDDLIVTRTDLLLKQLPRELEGTTIAFVADPHIGSFMTDAKYKKIISMTNELDADLVLHAGDLINSNLKDLPDGIEMLRQMRGRYGVYSCQGNHDCIEDRTIFERDTVRAGVNMLLDESRTIWKDSRKIQLLAPKWVGRNDNGSEVAVRNVLPFRDNDAFTILLAHHPHCFDEAALAKIPLTLGGHTHGGQLGLTKNIGFGSAMYRYWSGEYRKGDSACYVSNGVGNWFPLRVNVPCEIVHLTLRGA